MKILFLISNVSVSKITLCRGQKVVCELRVDGLVLDRSALRTGLIPYLKDSFQPLKTEANPAYGMLCFNYKTTMDKVQIRLRNASNHLQEPAEFNSSHFYLGTVTSSVFSQTDVHNIITHCYKLCFNIMLRPVPESKESVTQGVMRFFLEGKRLWPEFNTHLHLTPRLRKSGVIPPNPVIRHYGVDRDKFASSLPTNPLNFYMC